MKFLKPYLVFLTCLSLLLFFSTCKKYPENTLWCKNPYNYPIVQGYITEYKVNGIDSLDLLNMYYDTVRINDRYPYNKVERNVRKEQFGAFKRNKITYNVTNDLLGADAITTVKWKTDKKNIWIGAPLPDYRFFKKNLFIKSSIWEVVKLDPNGQKKIKNTFNGNTYEITFEK